MSKSSSEIQKNEIISLLLETLETQRLALVETALEAKEAATNEESKPENKYDTRALEASYLAGAQAKRSKELEKSIQILKSLKPKAFNENSAIDITALIRLESIDNQIKDFFLLPYAGGSKIIYKKTEYQVLTPESPLGLLLKGKKVGEVFNLKIKDEEIEYEIISVL